LGQGGAGHGPLAGVSTADLLVFGATSLVGSDLVASHALRVAAAGRTDPAVRGLPVERFESVDLANPARVLELVRDSPEPVIVNFAALTDVDAVERERPSPGRPPGGVAWSVNTQAAEAMARGAREVGKYMIQISTDFVFDGTAGPYAEESPVSPLTDRMNWYGWTKSEAERLVALRDPTSLIVRIAYPYRADFSAKLDFARWIVSRHKDGKLPPLFSDQQITPTWVPDLTRALTHLIPQKASGIVHIASPQVTSPFEFGRELLMRVGGAPVQITAGSMASGPSMPGRAPRPLKGGLRPHRARQLGVPLTSWRDGIDLFARESRGGA
jgi:dTDP-4-dehydrorhamnose reductase